MRAREYWFPFMGWYSPPGPHFGGNPRERDRLHGELGAFIYRWSAHARETGDLDLAFGAHFLWAALATWNATFSEPPEGPAHKLYEQVRAFLTDHADAWRTDNVAIDAVFEWDSILAARQKNAIDLGPLPPLQPPAWFPIWDQDSIAYGLIAIADRAFAARLSEEERGGLPVAMSTYIAIAKPLVRYISWCVPRIPESSELTEALGARMKRARIVDPKRAAKLTLLFLAERSAPLEPEERRKAYLAEARKHADRLFDERLRQRANRAGEVSTAVAEAEVAEEVDRIRDLIKTIGGIYFVSLVRFGAYSCSAASSHPDYVADHYAHHFVPGRFVGDHLKQERIERVRSTLRKKLGIAIRRKRPNDAVALTETVCGALGLAVRELCGENFETWIRVALGSQGGRTEPT